MITSRPDGLAARGGEFEDGLLTHIGELFDFAPDEDAGFRVKRLNFIAFPRIFYHHAIVNVV